MQAVYEKLESVWKKLKEYYNMIGAEPFLLVLV